MARGKTLWRAILPDKFKLGAMKSTIKLKSNNTAGEIKKDFEKTTRTWNHDVVFLVTKAGTFGMTVKVSTSDQIYAWVNDGTSARFLEGPVSVTTGFHPKTSPGVIGSTGGSKGSTTWAHNVSHPGSEARKFDLAIKEKWEEKLGIEFQLAMDAGALASGHSIFGFGR